NAAGKNFYPRYLARSLRSLAHLLRREPQPQRLVLALEPAEPLGEGVDLGWHFLRRGLEALGERAEDGLVLLVALERAVGGECLEPAHARRDRLIAHDLEEPDVAGRRHVRAAAKLRREARHGDDAHTVAVLL